MIIDIYIAIVVFIIGASIGSFICAMSERIYNAESFFKARSVCRNCDKELSPIDLIPVFSFMFLRGKCRYCKVKIPPDLFIAEVTLGILFVLSYLVARPLLYTNTTMFVLYWLFLLFNISFFFFIAEYDYKYYLILDTPVYILTAVYLAFFIVLAILAHVHMYLFSYADYTQLLIQHVLSSVILFIFFAIIYALTRGKGIGGGDVKLALLIGMLLGAKPTVIFLYVAFFSGAIISIIILLLKAKNLKDSIPFGPFLAFGVIIAILYAGVLLNTPFFSFVNYIGILL